MNKNTISNLLQKYRDGHCTETEILQIHLWYERLNQLSELELTEEEKPEVEARLWDQISQEINTTTPVRPIHRYPWALLSGVAATLLFVLGFSFYIFQTKVSENNTAVHYNLGEKDELIVKKNDSEQNQKITLADQSVVTLLPGSQLIYPKTFQPTVRAVALSGDAFFEISKNPDRPFLVHNGKLVTRVLGTSFWIKTNKASKTLQVEVVTGKVAVFENNPHSTPEALHKELVQGAVILTPNQQVTYFSENGHLLTSLVKIPRAISTNPIVQKQSYNHTSLIEIMSEFHRKYGIEIVLTNEEIEKCTFTGDVTDLSLYEALDLVCKSVNANYQLNGTRILINGQGCI